MKRHQSMRRRGTLVLCVLACLALVMAMAVVWAKTIGLERRHMRGRSERAQVDELVQSGLRRATAQLAADREYPGETWSVPADSLPDGHPAEVQIRIEAAGMPENRQIVVVARSPAVAVPRVTREGRLNVQLQKQEPVP